MTRLLCRYCGGSHFTSDCPEQNQEPDSGFDEREKRREIVLEHDEDKKRDGD